MGGKRKRRDEKRPALPRLENPDRIPAWVFLEPPPDFNSVELRGAPFFDNLETMGVRVVRVTNGSTQPVSIYRPWTYIYMGVPLEDFGPKAAELAQVPCVSIMMDCHFPIMDMENAIGSNATLIDIIDNKDMLLANLALAEVVTTPREDWAADLAEVVPNVFYLPDCVDEQSVMEFTVKMSEIAQTSMRVRLAKVGT